MSNFNVLKIKLSDLNFSETNDWSLTYQGLCPLNKFNVVPTDTDRKSDK